MILNAKQERAIYLLTAGISPITVVQELEITHDILQGWLQQPYFITALNTHKQVCRDANRNRLEYLFGRALNTLDELLKTGSAAEKLQAAQLLLDKFDNNASTPRYEPEACTPNKTEDFNQNTLESTLAVNTNIKDDILEDEPLKVQSSLMTEPVVEYAELNKVDETILEECLDDLQAFLDGNMTLEKAKARLYPIIDPLRLNQDIATKMLPAVIKQVNANQVKNLFVVKT